MSRRIITIVPLLLVAFFLAGCRPEALATVTGLPSAPASAIPTVPFTPVSAPPTVTPVPPLLPTLTNVPELSQFSFPASIDPAKQYLFYLHGKIIEDQGLYAVSPDFGEYEYETILKKLSEYGFAVISEQRPKNADVVEYAQKLVGQIKALLEAGVPARNITLVGASKGSYIAIYASHILENKAINFVLLGSCAPDEVRGLEENQIFLYGNILSIYDSVDNLAGSCMDLFQFSEDRGISGYNEVVLNVGTGHGILYKPLDEWILPVVDWARKDHFGD
jgi:hypothetical protein